MRTVEQARRAFRAATTRHQAEQIRGRYDRSVQQTRRMYFAVESLQRAAWRLREAEREAGRALGLRLRQA